MPEIPDSKSYWDERGTAAASSELDAVCYAGAPEFLNRYAARSQRLAVERLLERIGPLQGLRALDVGCGTGRWTRLLASRGTDATGVDRSEAMAREARRRSPEVAFETADAAALPFPDDSFDLAVAVTVIQHLTPEDQRLAVRELVRVVRPGGHVLAVDREGRPTQFAAGHATFPRERREWLELWRESGAAPVAIRGQEFSYPLRLARLAAPRGGDDVPSRPTATRRGSRGWRREVLRLLVLASALTESVVARAAPQLPAEHLAVLYRIGAGAGAGLIRDDEPLERG